MNTQLIELYLLRQKARKLPASTDATAYLESVNRRIDVAHWHIDDVYKVTYTPSFML